MPVARRFAVLLALGAIAPASAAASAANEPRPPGPARPNLLLVLVDDQAMNTFKPAFMPKTFRWIVRPGTKFVNGLAAPPLCCPDRAGILTGQYPHNNGVFGNSLGYRSLRAPRNVLPVWLHRAGYRTGLVGKFLNQYKRARGYAPAPGFGFWFAYDGLPRYFRYRMSDQGKPRFFGGGPRNYSTHVYTREALRFLRSRRRSPFFLWLAYNAPHVSRFTSGHCAGLDPLPPTGRAFRRVARLPLPRPPSFDETDVIDKPAAIQSLPPIDNRHLAELTRRYRCTVAALAPVDQGVARVMRDLRKRRELRRTTVVYLSDNGFYFGEHRLVFGKDYPYEPALQVPFAVRVPDAYRERAQPAAAGQVVSEQDVAATFLDYAGASSCASSSRCRAVDGRTLRPLLGGSGRWPADRGVLAELDDSGVKYAAVRTPRYLYAEYAGGERELYDLRADPFELQNRVPDPAYTAVDDTLAKRLAALRRCSGHAGPRPCE